MESLEKPISKFGACHDAPLVAFSRQSRPQCRRSSGVEHTLGKGGVASSILAGGTI